MHIFGCENNLGWEAEQRSMAEAGSGEGCSMMWPDSHMVNLLTSVCVAVRDTGYGLRPESLPRLFEPFYRPQNSAHSRVRQSASVRRSVSFSRLETGIKATSI